MLSYNLKLALRYIYRRRKSYLLNITGLIVALTVCLITAYYVIYERSYEKNRFTSNKVYSLIRHDNMLDWYNEEMNVGLSDFLEKSVPGVENVVRYKETGDYTVQVTKDKVYKEWTFHFVDNNFMPLIKHQMLAGNDFLSNPDDLLLTRNLAIKYFGSVNCIGERLKVFGYRDKTYEFTVSGVFDYPTSTPNWSRYNLIARLDILEKLHEDFNVNDYKTGVHAYLVLNKHTNKEDIANQAKTYLAENVDDHYERSELNLESYQQQYDRHRVKRRNIAIYISLVILVIALINFIIYSNAQFWERSKTIGINKIVGSNTKQIIIQNYLESLIINIFSLFIALFLSLLILPSVEKLLDVSIVLKLLPLGLIYLAFTLAIILISVIINLSGLFVSSFQPVKLISKHFVRGKKGKLNNALLMTFQVGVVTILLLLLLSVTRQINYMNGIEWGFNAEEVLSVGFRDNISPERFKDFRNRVNNIDGIISTAGCWHVPPDGDKFFIGYNDEAGNLVMIDRNTVGYDYFKTLQIKFLSGRDFDEDLDRSSDNIIVNTEFLKLKNINNPYDTLINMDDRWNPKQIVGVIESYHMRGMTEKIPPQVFLPDENETRNLIVKTETDNIDGTLKELEETYRAVFPELPFNTRFVEDEIQNLYETQENFKRLITYLSVISIVIACMGLFGFVMNEMNKRVKEIGIRKVNGAKEQEVFSLLNHDFIVISMLGFIVSLPLGLFFTNKWLEMFAYRVTPVWWIFILVLFMVLTIVLLTVSIQTWRIARKNPVEALRYE